jgi:hypothetical protein
MSLEEHPCFREDVQSGWTEEELIEDAVEMIMWAATNLNDEPCREEAQWLLNRFVARDPKEYTKDEMTLLVTLGSLYRLLKDDLQIAAENYNTLLVNDTQYVTQQLHDSES